MYLVISLLVLRAECGIWLCQSLIIAYLFTLSWLPIPRGMLHLFTWQGQFVRNRSSVLSFLVGNVTFRSKMQFWMQSRNLLSIWVEFRFLSTVFVSPLMSGTLRSHPSHIRALLNLWPIFSIVFITHVSHISIVTTCWWYKGPTIIVLFLSRISFANSNSVFRAISNFSKMANSTLLCDAVSLHSSMRWSQSCTFHC